MGTQPRTISKAEALAEAYKRGLLPPDKKAAYEEAQRRGLVGAPAQSSAPQAAGPAIPASGMGAMGSRAPGDVAAYQGTIPQIKPQTTNPNAPGYFDPLAPKQPEPQFNWQRYQSQTPPVPPKPTTAPEPGQKWALMSDPNGGPGQVWGQTGAIEADTQPNLLNDIGRGLIAPLQTNENARTIVAAPLQFGQGLYDGTRNMANNAMAVGTDAANAALNQFDPTREQFERPRITYMESNPLLEPGGALGTDAGMIPRAIGQFSAARIPIGKASAGGQFGHQAAKDAAAFALSTDHTAPRLSDMISSETPVLGPVADLLRSHENDPAIVSMLKNLGEDLTISSVAAGLLKLADTSLSVANRGKAAGQGPNPTLDPALAAEIRRVLNAPDDVAPAAAQAQPSPAAVTLQPPISQAPREGVQTATQAPPVQAAGQPPIQPPANVAAQASPPPQVPPPGTLTPVVPGNGVAVDSFNALPVKTREGMLRALSASGMSRDQAFAAIRSLNDLPPERANMFEAELIRRYGGPDQFPNLKTNLTAMGSDFSMQVPGKGGDPQGVMNRSLLEQAKSEGEYLERMAEQIFGPGKVATKADLEQYSEVLGGRYSKLLSEQYPGVGRMRGQNRLAEQQRIDGARSQLADYLKRPDVMANVPTWVQDEVMLRVSDDLRRMKFTPEEQAIILQGNPELAPLFTPDRDLIYSPKLWATIVDLYPTQVGHSLQSAYRIAIDSALKGTDAAQRTVAKRLMRMRGQSKVRANAANPDKRGFGLLNLLEDAVPGYKALREEFGDVAGATTAADMPNKFFRVAKDEEALDDFITVYNDELTPLQQEAVRNGITTQIRQALRNKTEFTDLTELDMPAMRGLPNITQITSQPFLEALPKVFGADGQRMVDAIRLSRANIGNIASINDAFKSGTPKGMAIQKNGRNIYENPSATDANPIDAATSTLAGVGGLAAMTGSLQVAAPVLGGAALRGLYRMYKRGKSLTPGQKAALAEWLFKPRRATDPLPPSTPKRFSRLGYAGNVATGAAVGATAGAFQGDPTTGALVGALGGATRAKLRSMRANRSIIPTAPPPPRPRNPLNPFGARGAQGAVQGAPPAPRQLPGQTSNASPTLAGAILGAGTSGAATYAATGDEEQALRNAILGGVGVGAATGLGAKLARSSSKAMKPKPPPAPKGGAKPPVAPPPPFKPVEGAEVIDTSAWTPAEFNAARRQLNEMLQDRRTMSGQPLAELDREITSLRAALDPPVAKEFSDVPVTSRFNAPVDIPWKKGSPESLAIEKAIADKRWKIEAVPLSKVIPTQDSVFYDYAKAATRYAGDERYPLVVKQGDQYFVADGHHRMMAQQGGDQVRARVIDMDTPTPGGKKPPEQAGPPKPLPPPKRSAIKDAAGRAVAGAAVGTAISATDALAQSAEMTNEFLAPLEEERKRIRELEDELNIILHGTIEEKQAYLAETRGLKISASGEPDGRLGPDTRAAIIKARTDLEAALAAARDRETALAGKAETRRAAIEQQMAFERTNPSDAQQAFRDWAPLVGATVGAIGSKALRLGGVALSKRGAQAAIRKSDALLSGKSTIPPSTKPAEINKRATNLNEFWQRGGATSSPTLREKIGLPRPKGTPPNGVPFETSPKTGEWKARPSTKVTPPQNLFPDKFIGSRLRAGDVLIGGTGVIESYLADQHAQKVKVQLEEARLIARDDPSEKNLARVQSLEDQYATAKAWSAVGAGVAAGTILGLGTSKYASRRANVPQAERELAQLRQYLASQGTPVPPTKPMPPPKPRRASPKATPPKKRS